MLSQNDIKDRRRCLFHGGTVVLLEEVCIYLLGISCRLTMSIVKLARRSSPFDRKKRDNGTRRVVDSTLMRLLFARDLQSRRRFKLLTIMCSIMLWMSSQIRRKLIS